MEQFHHTLSNKNLFEKQLLTYFEDKKNVVYLNSNNVDKVNLFAVSDSDFVVDDNWKFGFITYDYKNQVEDLSSGNFDGIKFPVKHFFTPEILFKIGENEVEIDYNNLIYSKDRIDKLITVIEDVSYEEHVTHTIAVTPRISKQEYLKNVNLLKQHIQLGDIYEVNYCQEYFATGVEINPVSFYLKLNEKSPTPFSCFVKCDDKYLMSATPERFIQKSGDRLISQPIKGTVKRGVDYDEDEKLKKELYHDIKERSENVMIVDLVRNDLSKIAVKGSVSVDELCGIYTFPQVHQMISTVSSKVLSDVNFDDIIKATFPMGSMTGAPKIRAMKLIEQYETTKRGLYAGTVGYINEVGDFDFNVIIRSLQYNKEDEYLSFIVGGAITALSDPEKEYEECLLKAKAMFEVLRN